MEQVPKVVRQRLQATAKTGMHPDPNLLTAFAEKTLREPERTRILQHLGNCADCRNILSLSMPQIEVPPSTSPISSPWLSWPLLRWGALAACVIVVGAAVTLHREWLPGRSPFGSGEAPTPPPPMGDVTDEGKASKQPPQKLAAKVVPPSSFQSDRDSLKAETLAKQDDQADTRSMATTSVVNGLPTNQEKNQLEMNQRLKAQLTKAPATNADAAKSSDKALTAAAQLAAPAAAASPATKTINTQGRGNERNDNLDYGARTGNEIVTTEAQAVPIEEVAPAARDGAKDESQKYDARKKAQSPSAGVLGGVSLADRKAVRHEHNVATLDIVCRRYPATLAGFRQDVANHSCDGQPHCSSPFSKRFRYLGRGCRGCALSFSRCRSALDSGKASDGWRSPDR